MNNVDSDPTALSAKETAGALAVQLHNAYSAAYAHNVGVASIVRATAPIVLNGFLEDPSLSLSDKKDIAAAHIAGLTGDYLKSQYGSEYDIGMTGNIARRLMEDVKTELTARRTTTPRKGPGP